MAHFEYDLEKVYTKDIEVEDAGNCALKCTNNVGEEWYIQLQSIMGTLYILKFGPIVDGIDILDWDFELSYKKAKYSDKTIDKEVKTFINDPKKLITEIEEIDATEVLNLIPAKDAFIPV